jgi:catechol 2,3-dioxygenase-like lactoylglutathione lyase family enzyme
MQIFAAIPVLHVADIEASLRFYTAVLGFDEEFRFGDYAGLRLGEAGLHLTTGGDFRRPVGGGTVYLTCDGVDAYHDVIVARGARPKAPPANAGYGMRDFMINDPDGNQLSFGCEVAQPDAANDDQMN